MIWSCTTFSIIFIKNNQNKLILVDIPMNTIIPSLVLLFSLLYPKIQHKANFMRIVFHAISAVQWLALS